MSFSSQVKDELEKVVPSAGHCRAAALAAILYCSGRLDRSTNTVTFLADRTAQMRKCFTLLRKSLNIDGGLKQSKMGGSASAKNRYQVVLPRGKADELFELLKITDRGTDGSFRDLQETVAPALLERVCCRRAFLREMFIACGSITDPSKDYHLEFDCPGRQQAEQVQRVLCGLGKSAGIVPRGKLFIVYLKDSADIVETLNLMGAPVSMMAMENQRILKDLRNTVNRRVNCETANIGKTVAASGKQIEGIRFLEERGILGTLPENLRQIARLRLEYPDAPLRELGELAVPPIGKSGVNHRLRKLMETAEKYRSE